MPVRRKSSASRRAAGDIQFAACAARRPAGARPRRGPRSRTGYAGALRIEVQGRTRDRTLLSPVLLSRLAAQCGVLAKLLRVLDVVRARVVLELQLPTQRRGRGDPPRGCLQW